MNKISDQIKIWIDILVKSASKALHNKDSFIFLLFLLLSTGLWVLNALRKDYTTTIYYPVSYGSLPEGYMLMGKPVKYVQIRVKSSGYSILPYYIGNKKDPIPLQVSEFRNYVRGTSIGAAISSKELTHQIQKELTNEVELIDIAPDSLTVMFEKLVSKKVPVILKSDLSFQKGFFKSNNVRLRPDSVIVAGASTVIDTMMSVSTNLLSLSALNDTVNEVLDLISEDYCTLSNHKVEVQMPVEAFTQKDILVPIQSINVPDSLVLKSFPQSIKVSFRVAISRFNVISPSEFSLLVDFNSYNGDGLPDKLKVKMENYPEMLQDISYAPFFIDCLFEKQNVQ